MVPGPTCLLHVPKSAGTSMRLAIEHALPPGRLAPWYSEPSIYADFDDFAAMPEPFRSTVATDPSHITAMRSYTAVVGHFTLPLLLQVTEPAAIGTVLREPRARLVSYYAYWRLTPGLAQRVAPYQAAEHARRPLADFLSEPRMARSTDNQLCRLLLFGDPRLPDTDFIAPADVPAIADAATERLDLLGFVGITERDAEAWDGIARLFGLTLERLRLNVTGEAGVEPGTLPAPAPDWEAVLDLLDERCAADRIVYGRVAARCCGGEATARRVADAAFAQQLVRFGDTTGDSAAAVHSPDERFDGLLARIEERDREIVRLHQVVADRDAEIARVHPVAAEQAAEITRLHAAVADRDRTIMELRGPDA